MKAFIRDSNVNMIINDMALLANDWLWKGTKIKEWTKRAA